MNAMKLGRIRGLSIVVLWFAALTVTTLVPFAQAEVEADSAGTVYVVGTAHLDTQWRWTIQETINEYLPATMRENFALFDQFPDYTFSFEGSFRYRLMEEYYPEDYERLKEYMKQDRWRVCGSWVDAVDVNVPSPESLIRHTLYGNGFFREEFNQSSVDIYLPDCFGFGYALPTIARHSGLTGFSTQKLGWGCWVGKPFDIGRWRGVDGSEIIAAVNPDAYVSKLRVDLSADSSWRANVERQREDSGLAVGYKYFGVGDTGGGPDSLSVALLEQAINDPTGPLNVRSVGADQLYRDMSDEQKAQLPLYDGELIMTSHGVGCYTSQSTMKRWNAQNENLAQAAERAAALAHYLGGYEYPRETLQQAWERFLWHQFHDDLTGTSIPEAYAFSWNDELLSLNQFSEVLQDAVGSIASGMDTNVDGTPLVVFNPTGFAREGFVEAVIPLERGESDPLWAIPPSITEPEMHRASWIPVQVLERSEREARILFRPSVNIENLPPFGAAVYSIQTEQIKRMPSKLRKLRSVSVSETTIKNDYYTVQVTSEGDLLFFARESEGVQDSVLMRLAILENEPRNWAAWEIDFDDIMAEPAYVSGPPEIRIVEKGPVRSAIEITRHYGNSTFIQTVRLGKSFAPTIDFEIDWQETGSLLKAEFTGSISNGDVKYDLGVGSIVRGLNKPELYEVPAQKWVHMVDADRAVSSQNKRGLEEGSPTLLIATSDRYGWDHPDAETLRLTLLHTPGVNKNWRWIDDQKSQDIGTHFTSICLSILDNPRHYPSAHALSRVQDFNQPLRAFVVDQHDGPLGRSVNLMDPAIDPETQLPDDHAYPRITSVKLAEDSDELVVRIHNPLKRSLNGYIVRFISPVVEAREINGQEDDLGVAEVQDGMLVVNLAAYEIKAFAVKLAPRETQVDPLTSLPVELPFNHDGISFDSDRTNGDLDGHGYTIPGELWPDELVREGIRFTFADANSDLNLVRCDGQKLELPKHESGAELVLLVASTDGHREVDFRLGRKKFAARVNAIDGFIGQWDSRLVGGRFVEDPEQILPAWIERDPVAWVGTHRHSPEGENEAYTFNYFYKVVLPLSKRTKTVTLPKDGHILVAAATLVENPRYAETALPLYDAADAIFPVIENAALAFADQTDVALNCRWVDAKIHYTLDGSDPTLESPEYAGPFTVSSSMTVSAAAFLDGHDSHVVRAVFEKLEPRSAVEVGELDKGLKCKLFLGEWDLMPDTGTLTPVSEKIIHEIAIVEEAPDELFCQIMTGYLRVPETGLYTISLTSDDGSMLYLGDELAIDSDGLHGAVKVETQQMLEAGYHPIKIEMFQKMGGKALSSTIQDPEGDVHPLGEGWIYTAK
jgi:alpha-mannosidase